MAKKTSKFVCGSCGYEVAKWMGKCPGCHDWNTMVEERTITKPAAGKRSSFAHSKLPTNHAPVALKEVVIQDEARVVTSFNEFNRVLGSGVVPGSLVLIGGDPGIGKSTLLLQVSSQLAENGHVVLYISGEESVRQTKLRADRLGAISENNTPPCNSRKRTNP